MADRVKRYADGMVSIPVTREELTRLRQAVASMPGPTLADFPSNRRWEFPNEVLADCEAKRGLLKLLAFAEAKFGER